MAALPLFQATLPLSQATWKTVARSGQIVVGGAKETRHGLGHHGPGNHGRRNGGCHVQVHQMVDEEPKVRGGVRSIADSLGWYICLVVNSEYRVVV